MGTILILAVALSILILVHEIGHFVAAKWAGIRVFEFGIGMGPRLLKLWNDGETDYTINVLPIGGFVKMQGENPGIEEESNLDPNRSFENKSPLVKAVVLVAGIAMNFAMAVVLIAIVFAGLGKPEANIVMQISQIAENSPAQSANLVTDNLILGYKKVDDPDFPAEITQEDFLQFVDDHKGVPIEFLIQTSVDDTTQASIQVTPRTDPPEGEGPLGIQFYQSYTIDYLPMELWRIPAESIKTAFELAQAIVAGLSDMVSDLITKGIAPTGIAGPVGVAKLTNEAAQQGFFQLLQFLAIISINLTIVNILPFPALDGGRLLFVVLEGITGKKILSKYEGWIHTVGFFILIGLVFILSYYDIKRFF